MQKQNIVVFLLHHLLLLLLKSERRVAFQRRENGCCFSFLPHQAVHFDLQFPRVASFLFPQECLLPPSSHEHFFCFVESAKTRAMKGCALYPSLFFFCFILFHLYFINGATSKPPATNTLPNAFYMHFSPKGMLSI